MEIATGQRSAASEYVQLLLNLPHDQANLRCVPADAERCYQFVNRQFRQGDRAKTERLSPAFQSLIGGHPDEQGIRDRQAFISPSRSCSLSTWIERIRSGKVSILAIIMLPPIIVLYVTSWTFHAADRPSR